MNRINELLNKKRSDILSVYCTAGYPSFNDTIELCEALSDAGVDMIEVGFPFSDPVADGPVIQKSSEIALANGMTLEKLFEQLTGLRKRVTIPVLLMGYFNVVLQYGVSSFCAKCKEVGIDGTILPDLPLEEYVSEYKEEFEKNSLCNILLATPQTSEKRLRLIDSNTSGFIYLLSATSTTGKKIEIGNTTESYLKRIQSLGLKHPSLVGFGISDRRSIERVNPFVAGVVVGSAFIRSLEGSKNIKDTVQGFISILRGKL